MKSSSYSLIVVVQSSVLSAMVAIAGRCRKKCPQFFICLIFLSHLSSFVELRDTAVPRASGRMRNSKIRDLRRQDTTIIISEMSASLRRKKNEEDFLWHPTGPVDQEQERYRWWKVIRRTDGHLLTKPLMKMGTVTGKTERQTAS